MGVVDEDNTSTTREILRNMDAFSQVHLTEDYASVSEARRAMQQGKIYAFYYIPEGTTEKILSSRQPTVSFYTNNSLLIAGSLIYRDLRTMSVLANASVGLQTLQAKGMDERTAMAFLQPIVIDTHALSNPVAELFGLFEQYDSARHLDDYDIHGHGLCHRERNQGGYREGVVGHGGQPDVECSRGQIASSYGHLFQRSRSLRRLPLWHIGVPVP